MIGRAGGRAQGADLGVEELQQGIAAGRVDSKRSSRIQRRIDDVLAAQRWNRAAKRWIVSTDPEEHVEKIRPYLDMGFRHLVFHAPGPDQVRFLRLYGEQVLPKLRQRFD